MLELSFFIKINIKNDLHFKNFTIIVVSKNDDVVMASCPKTSKNGLFFLIP